MAYESTSSQIEELQHKLRTRHEIDAKQKLDIKTFNDKIKRNKTK